MKKSMVVATTVLGLTTSTSLAQTPTPSTDLSKDTICGHLKGGRSVTDEFNKKVVDPTYARLRETHARLTALNQELGKGPAGNRTPAEISAAITQYLRFMHEDIQNLKRREGIVHEIGIVESSCPK